MGNTEGRPEPPAESGLFQVRPVEGEQIEKLDVAEFSYGRAASRRGLRVFNSKVGRMSCFKGKTENGSTGRTGARLDRVGLRGGLEIPRRV